ncbi:MAG: RluA family pseudouridine synthase [Bacteroidales bacterium]
MPILYEDNHLLVVNKRVSDIVQGDQTGDPSLDRLLKEFIKERDGKPGEVFMGIPHRIDRPVSGAVVFAKTGKALSRMAQLFKEQQVEKIYHAIVDKCPDPESGILEHYLTRNTKQNKSYAHDKEVPGSKLARLRYRKLASSDHYHLLEVILETGRHHQIRAQLAAVGSVIKGDRKYGARRTNKNGGISLHARKIAFIHPVRQEPLEVVAPYPKMDIFPVFKVS